MLFILILKGLNGLGELKIQRLPLSNTHELNPVVRCINTSKNISVDRAIYNIFSIYIVGISAKQY